MRNDIKGNKEHLAPEIALNAEYAAKVDDYCARAGIILQDFATRVGYAYSTLRHFIGGNYHFVGGTGVHIRAAIDKFIAEHPIAPPTKLQGELYRTENVKAIEDVFDRLLARPVAYMTYGPPGSQKSFTLEHRVSEVNRQALSEGTKNRAFYIYCREKITPFSLIRRVTKACGSRVTADIDTMLDNLRFDYNGRRVVLVFDEAQHLSYECFETVRELLDRPPYFSLLFAGSHDLKKYLDRCNASLEQLNRRIIDKVILPGLSKREAEGICDREIGFLLNQLPAETRRTTISQLVTEATRKDSFNKGKEYINVGTLVNSLDEIKHRAQQLPGGQA